MLPPLAAILLPKFKQPLDFHATFRGKRIFGDHKTIRGILIGTIFGGLTFFLQVYLFNQYPLVKDFSLIDYAHTSPLFGFSLAFGSLIGDAVKSFFKRQFSLPPGTSWFPWDQIDWVIGSLCFAVPFMKVDFTLFASFIVTGLLLHLFIKLIGFLIRINETVI